MGSGKWQVSGRGQEGGASQDPGLSHSCPLQHPAAGLGGPMGKRLKDKRTRFQSSKPEKPPSAHAALG